MSMNCFLKEIKNRDTTNQSKKWHSLNRIAQQS